MGRLLYRSKKTFLASFVRIFIPETKSAVLLVTLSSLVAATVAQTFVSLSTATIAIQRVSQPKVPRMYLTSTRWTILQSARQQPSWRHTEHQLSLAYSSLSFASTKNNHVRSNRLRKIRMDRRTSARDTTTIMMGGASQVRAVAKQPLSKFGLTMASNSKVPWNVGDTVWVPVISQSAQPTPQIVERHRRSGSKDTRNPENHKKKDENRNNDDSFGTFETEIPTTSRQQQQKYDTMYCKGIIRECRKGGWYTIELFEGSNKMINNTNKKIKNPTNTTTSDATSIANTVKFRGSQLQRQPPTELDNFYDNSLHSTISNPPHVHSDSATNTMTTTSMKRLSGRKSKLYIKPSQNEQPQHLPLPPPPTIHDLDEILRMYNDTNGNNLYENSSSESEDRDHSFFKQLNYIQTHVNEWVVFSDLHCSIPTLDTCLKVLDHVHEIARKRSFQNLPGTDGHCKCGILFLGDFWHHRTTVRIDLLNAVLMKLKSFTVPMIMIPGNHDQCTFQGHNHGLTPLGNAYRIPIQASTMMAPSEAATTATNVATGMTTIPGVLIFTYPTKFLDALFVPHIRSNAIMESVLQSPEARTSRAIFVHADITGACMNDHLISTTTGISPEYFPSEASPLKAIYSGHFHKPHIVKRATNIYNSGDNLHKDGCPKQPDIEYVGSPYEVSLSEANQTKALLVLDSSKQWDCVQRIPIRIGRKHYKIYSLYELESVLPNVQSGDRIVWYQSKQQQRQQHEEFIQSYEDNKIKYTTDEKRGRSIENKHQINPQLLLAQSSTKLKELGVTLEIREMNQYNSNDSLNIDVGHEQNLSTLSPSDILEELTPLSLWKAFLDHEFQKGDGSLTNSKRLPLEEVGTDILNELEHDRSDVDISSTNNHNNNHESLIQPVNEIKTAATSTTSSGSIASQKGSSRGGNSGSIHGHSISASFQLLSVSIQGFGPFRDEVTYPLYNRGLVLIRGTNKDGGSDSNGTGKTALTMSILWALTGSLDPRPMQDSKVTDVVNDASKCARVTLKGKWNEIDFSISRTKTATKSGLVFIFDGQDVSAQSAKETQDVINERLGISPHILTRTMFQGQYSLNELLDSSDTKLKEELALVVPIHTWQEASALARKLGRDATTEVSRLEGMISLRSEDLQQLQAQLKRLQATVKVKEQCYHDALRDFDMEIKGQPLSQSADMDIDVLEHNVQTAAKAVQELEDQKSRMMESRSEAIDMQKRIVDNFTASLPNTIYMDSLRNKLRDLRIEEALASQRVATLEQTWNLDLSLGKPKEFVLPTDCPTCGHALVDSFHESKCITDKIEQEFNNAMSTLTSIQEQKLEVDSAIKAAEDVEAKSRAALENAQKVLYDFDRTWAQRIAEVDNKILAARSAYKVSSEKLSTFAKVLHDSVKVQGLRSTLAAEKQALEVACDNLDRAQLEFDQCSSSLSRMNDTKLLMANRSKIMNDLAVAFGPRGIQAFILNNMVKTLESMTQSYLDELSDGAQRLTINLDGGDRITRRAFVRGENGDFKERPMASLSGGQWKRCSLAFSFAFTDILARRGNFRPSICVLDEPLTHLDHSGRADVGRILRQFLHRTESVHGESAAGARISTILIILQDLAAEELEESFDRIDEVVKENGRSHVIIDE